MPFGLHVPGSGSKSSSAKSSNFKSIKHNESGRFNMSGIMNDGQSKKSYGKKEPPQPQYQYKQSAKQTPPRSRTPPRPRTPPRSRNPSGGGIPQRPRSDNRYPPQQYHQMTQQQQFHQPSPSPQQQHQQSVHHHHGSIPHSFSNNSHGSLHSSHSKQSAASIRHRRTNSSNSSSGHSRSSSGGNGRQFHPHQHQQHIRVHSTSSDVGSVHSLPTATSRSTASDPNAGHGRNGVYFTPNTANPGNNTSRRTHPSSLSHGNIPMDNNLYRHTNSIAEHRDTYTETTNTRRNQYNQLHNGDYHHQFHPHTGFHTPARHQSSPLMIKPTPLKSSNASVGSHHSRGSASYNTVSGKTNGASTPVKKATVAPRVSTDKHAIKSTKKVIEELKKSAENSYPSEKRIIALTNACAEFDHLDASRHNMELQNGVASVLCKVLAVILNNADAKDGYDYDVDRDYDFDQKSVGSHGTDADKNDAEGHDRSDVKKEVEEDSVKQENPGTSEENSNSDDSNDGALRMIATALEMVFRGQSDFVCAAYEKCGGSIQYDDSAVGLPTTGLLPLLLRLLERAEGLHHGHRMKKHNADVALAKTAKTVLYLSRVAKLRTHLARQTTLLDALSRVANNEIYNGKATNSEFNATNMNSLDGEARVTRVRIIANLVNEEENKTLILSHGLAADLVHANISGKGIGVLDAILRVAHVDPNERAREYAGAALMDLASAPSNQVPMTKNGRLLATLVKMILIETNQATQESAITALQNLAFAKENRILLASFKHGVVLEALIQALSNGGNGFNEKSRRRAAGALTNLACDESAEAMGMHKGLLQTLAMVSTKDTSPEVQTRAAMALTKLAASVTMRMEEHPSNTTSTTGDDEQGKLLGEKPGIYSTLMDALVVASLSPVSNNVSAVLRVKARDPESRYLMAQHPGVLDTLADMCLYVGNDSNHEDDRIIRGTRSSGSHGVSNYSHHRGEDENPTYSIDVLKDRDNATRALMHLTNEPKNRTIMCIPTVLKALVRGASVTDTEIQAHQSRPQEQKHFLDIRDSAVRAIERMATEFTNRHTMAHHEGLLVAIAHATEREAKLEAESSGSDNSGGDTAQIPVQPRKLQQQEQQSMQHTYLAKPLLMSLLVAM